MVTVWNFEALSIVAAVKHFSPFIIQSTLPAYILTDSKPCVQAKDKLRRGEFSARPRVTSFLAIVSRYQAELRQLAGTANIFLERESTADGGWCATRTRARAISRARAQYPQRRVIALDYGASSHRATTVERSRFDYGKNFYNNYLQLQYIETSYAVIPLPTTYNQFRWFSN